MKVRQASKHCPIVVVSIFVNPAQFAPNEDLDNYPRSLSEDLELLRSLNCVDAVFLPKTNDIFLGQKDAQQCIVIRTLISDLHFPIEMHVGATKREHDGLAMSSRNRYLTPDMRNYASILYNALTAIKNKFDKGERNGGILL